MSHLKMGARNSWLNVLASASCSALLLAACGHTPASRHAVLSAAEQSAVDNADQFLIVDCLLPGRVRTMGQLGTVITARRPLRTAAGDCAAQGGEYVAYNRANYQTALNVWLDKAKAGDAEAQTYVGEIYEKRQKAPDYQQAAHWYQKAAEQGFSRAQISLGNLYEQGRGVPRDPVAAMNWYRKASGLDEDNLAFASTVETVVRSEYAPEIQLLKSALSQSQQETGRLKQSLRQSRTHLKKEHRQLARLQNDWQRKRQTLDTLKARPASDTQQREIKQLTQTLQAQRTRLTQQRTQVQRLENQISAQTGELTTRLKKARQRVSLLNQELTQQQQATDQNQTQLIQSELHLAETEAQLLKLQKRYRAEKSALSQRHTQHNTHQATTLANQTQQVQQLSQQIALRQSELAQQRQQLAELERRKQRLNLSQQQLAQQQNAGVNPPQTRPLEKQLHEYTQQLTQHNQRIAQLEQEKQALNQNLSRLNQSQKQVLTEKNQTLQALQTQIQAQQQQLARAQQRVATLQKQQQAKAQVAYAPPSIEIIEPPFTLTRGIRSVTLRANIPQRAITGKVIATAGLKAFDINGHKTSVNDRGLFTSLVKLRAKQTPVKLIAVDHQGQKATLEFLLMASKAVSAPRQSPRQALTNVDFGRFHALIIGNSRYRSLPSLKSPGQDAQQIESVLKRRYGFQTQLLMDADRYTILSKLNKLRKQLSKQDNLLIYYAGHGELDQVNMRGHWLPVDAEADSTANWISTVAITDILNAMSTRKVLVVSDSCYSGAMTLASIARLEPGVTAEQKQKWLQTMSQAKSRMVLTSGGLEPVLDAGAGQHSVFAQAFIQALEHNQQLLDGQTLYRKVTDQFQRAANRIELEQIPQYGPIKHGGHESGDFFLVPSTVGA